MGKEVFCLPWFPLYRNAGPEHSRLVRRITCECRVVAAFFGAELDEVGGDPLAAFFEGARGGPAHKGLEFDEGPFNWVEVGRIGRPIEHLRPCARDGLALAGHLVARQVARHDEIAGIRAGHQDLIFRAHRHRNCLPNGEWRGRFTGLPVIPGVTPGSIPHKKRPGHEAPASRTGRLYVWET